MRRPTGAYEPENAVYLAKLSGALQLVVHGAFQLDTVILSTGSNDDSTPIVWQICRSGRRRDHAACYLSKGVTTEIRREGKRKATESHHEIIERI